MRSAVALLVLALLVGGCAPGQGGLRLGLEPSASPASAGATKEQIRGVVDRYLAAYNAGDINTVASLLADDVAAADCDYGVGARARSEGKGPVTGFLQQRFALHDHFEVDRIAVRDDAGGASILYKRRTNDALTARGIAADTTLAGSVILFRGLEIVQLNTGDVAHCSEVVSR